MPRANWADFKDKKPGTWEIAEEVYGRTEAGQIREAISASIEDERNFVAVYREDLSFVNDPK